MTVSNQYDEYAKSIQKQLYELGYECDTDLDAGNTLNKKVRNAQLAHYNFILVVGEKETQSGTANVRTRDNKVHGEIPISEIIRRFNILVKSKTNVAEDEFGTIKAPASADGISKQVESVSLNQVDPVVQESSDSSAKYC